MPESKKRRKKHSGYNKRLEKKLEMVQRLNPFVSKYIKKLEIENERMKTDPQSVVGQLIPQMRETIAQNKRLSVLAASLIKASGGSVTVNKEDLESFESKVLSIKWHLPEGATKIEDSSDIIFTYEALTQEEADARNAQVVVTPNEGELATVETISAKDEEINEKGLKSPINNPDTDSKDEEDGRKVDLQTNQEN